MTAAKRPIHAPPGLEPRAFCLLEESFHTCCLLMNLGLNRCQLPDIGLTQPAVRSRFEERREVNLDDFVMAFRGIQAKSYSLPVPMSSQIRSADLPQNCYSRPLSHNRTKNHLST